MHGGLALHRELLLPPLPAARAGEKDTAAHVLSNVGIDALPIPSETAE
jgi:hypothetical protein